MTYDQYVALAFGPLAFLIVVAFLKREKQAYKRDLQEYEQRLRRIASLDKLAKLTASARRDHKGWTRDNQRFIKQWRYRVVTDGFLVLVIALLTGAYISSRF